jgi:hypothetical protein
VLGRPLWRLAGRTTLTSEAVVKGGVANLEGSSSAALNLLVQVYSEDDLAHRRAHGSQLDRRVRPVLGDHRLVGKSPEGSRQRGGRLKLHVACLRRLRSGAYRWSHLWVLGTFSDRSCPLLSAVRRSAADPARTEWSFRSRLVADAFGAPVLRDQGPIGRPGTARPMKALATVLFVSGPHWLSFDLAGWPLICGEIVLL